MKMLVISLVGVGGDQLLGDEPLTNLHQLAAAGSFGRLGPAAPGEGWREESICAQVAAVGGQIVRLDEGDDLALRTLAAGSWDYLRFGVSHLAGGAAPSQAADHRIGRILELLDNETVVLIFLGPAPESPDGFVLAAPNYPPLSELRNVTLPDLARTLLDMAAYDVPEALPGRSLVAGLAPDKAEGLSDHEEALLRARLQGLGYLG